MKDLDGTLWKYPDEPHPDNEWEWKCWWVKRMFTAGELLPSGASQWIHDCWRNTKATWHLRVTVPL